MAVLESLDAIRSADAGQVGSKARALAALAEKGFMVPPAVCVTVDSYEQYMAETNLRDRVMFELGRKAFDDMRWEEIWDAALRIRNLFLSTALPEDIDRPLRDSIGKVFGEAPVVVRSSAPGEDSGETSFAGLHESFVNVKGVEQILKHIRLVWASLWSDAALLYRQELGLDVAHNSMAVIIQAIAAGDSSGVAFSRNPTAEDEAVVEAVHGLNAGLVDGTVEPDRWTLARNTGELLSHTAPERDYAMMAGESGIEKVKLDPARAGTPPLAEPAVITVHELSLAAEKAFGAPQDVEWTRVSGDLSVLQSRPITTLSPDSTADNRAWYRSLSRSFENLKTLRRRIEDQWIPGMEREAAELAGVDLSGLSDSELSQEVARREGVYEKWRDVYWTDCIPFAHGVRLFGQYYNDMVEPRNPYEFMDLLAGTGMLSLARNQGLEDLAEMIRGDPGLRAAIQRGDRNGLSPEFSKAVDIFRQEHGDLPASSGSSVSADFLAFLLELSDAPASESAASGSQTAELTDAFLAAVPEAERNRAEEMLEMARASHRWRDDDNIYLDAIEAEWRRSASEMARRGEGEEWPGKKDDKAPSRPGNATHSEGVPTGRAQSAKPRQLVGQPAGPGLAAGVARVVGGQEDLLGFKRGEVLVCDALSPTMTFAVPLASAVIERRGGMLIHGAIIAREYGIPCVTGVPDAASLIQTGMRLTVDGYLGIVRVHSDGE
jgi:pyruvate,water dikinase